MELEAEVIECIVYLIELTHSAAAKDYCKAPPLTVARYHSTCQRENASHNVDIIC